MALDQNTLGFIIISLAIVAGVSLLALILVRRRNQSNDMSDEEVEHQTGIKLIQRGIDELGAFRNQMALMMVPTLIFMFTTMFIVIFSSPQVHLIDQTMAIWVGIAIDVPDVIIPVMIYVILITRNIGVTFLRLAFYPNSQNEQPLDLTLKILNHTSLPLEPLVQEYENKRRQLTRDISQAVIP